MRNTDLKHRQHKFQAPAIVFQAPSIVLVLCIDSPAVPSCLFPALYQAMSNWYSYTQPCMLRPHSHNPYWYGIMAFIFAVTCIHILKYVYTLSINTSLHTYLHHPKFVSNRSQSSQIITVGTAVTAVAAVAAFASPAASPPPTSPLSPSPPAISNSCRQSPSNTDTDAASRCVQHLPQYTIPHLEQRVGRGHW